MNQIIAVYFLTQALMALSSELTIKKRKDQLDNTLGTYRHAKMNKRLLPDSQITGIAKLELKKRMVEQIDKMDKVH